MKLIHAATIGCILFVIFVGASVLDASAQEKPVLLYSRYFNAPGENRYLPDGTYKEVLEKLRSEFDVRINDQPLDAATLAGVNVVLVANPNEKAARANPPPHHVSPADIQNLTHFVAGGGGFIVMGNQEGHNLEIVDMNRLLAQFGLQFTNLYTDAKKLVIPADTPIIGGLAWGYYTGNQVLITPNHPARPRALILNDLNQKPANGLPRDTPGALLAIAEPGKGRVIVVTDAGWLTNEALDEKGIGSVALKGVNNWEMFRRLAHWAAGK